MEDEKKSVTIYSYTKVWKVDKKVYSISNIALPFPINPYELLSYIGVALIMTFLGKVFLFVAHIPAVLRYVMLPYLITSCLNRMKLDGKNPVKYFAGCLKYFVTVKGTFRQLFKCFPDKKTYLKLNWSCSVGRK